MSLETPLTLRLYWDCAIRRDSHGHFFDGGAMKILTLRNQISYSNLVQRICEYRGLDVSRVKIRITMRDPDIFGSVISYTTIIIKDDDDMQLLWQRTTNQKGLSIDLHIHTDPVLNVAAVQDTSFQAACPFTASLSNDMDTNVHSVIPNVNNTASSTRSNSQSMPIGSVSNALQNPDRRADTQSLNKLFPLAEKDRTVHVTEVDNRITRDSQIDRVVPTSDTNALITCDDPSTFDSDNDILDANNEGTPGPSHHFPTASHHVSTASKPTARLYEQSYATALENLISRPPEMGSHSNEDDGNFHIDTWSHGIDPGPIRPDLLTLQHKHRSRFIWDGHIGNEPLNVRRSDSKFWLSRPFDPRVEALMDRAGFGGIRQLCYMKIDHALITALIERWRPETHTFHLTIGEATITLQDIEVLSGLRVDGDPIYYGKYTDTLNHLPSTIQGWQDMCMDLLGFCPNGGDIDGGRMKLITLEGPLAHPLPQAATAQVVEQHTRCRIMQLIGGFLFADKSGNRVHLRWLVFLRDLERSGTLSWGSAALAHLYRCLCIAADHKSHAVGGPMVILQLWAWERIPIVRPGIIHSRDEVNHAAPRGARWHVPLDLTYTSTHVLAVYRDQLDGMSSNHFVWQPYTDQILQSLPSYCRHGKDIWCSVTSLICWDVIELNCPNRVKRQFGLLQEIPNSVDTSESLHKRDLRSAGSKWDEIDTHHLSLWATRRDRICSGQPATDVTVASEGYIAWYRTHTRHMIGNPKNRQQYPTGYQPTGSIVEILADGIQHMLFIANEACLNADVSSVSAFKEIVRIGTERLRAAGMERQLRLPPFEPSRRLHDSNPLPPIQPHPHCSHRNEPPVHVGGRRRCGVAKDIPQPDIGGDEGAHQEGEEHGDDANVVNESVATQHLAYDTRCVSSPNMTGDVAASSAQQQSSQLTKVGIPELLAAPRAEQVINRTTQQPQSQEEEGSSRVTEEEVLPQISRRVQPPRKRKGYHCRTSYHPY